LYKTAFSAQDQHVIFALGATRFSFFHQRARVCTKQRFQNEISMFCIFALGAPLFIVFSNVHEFVQNRIFSKRSACLVIFALGAPLFSDFQQRARVCTKQRLQPKISTFCYFRTRRTTS